MLFCINVYLNLIYIQNPRRRNSNSCFECNTKVSISSGTEKPTHAENSPLAQKNDQAYLITLSQYYLFHAEIQYKIRFSHQADSN